MSKGRMGVETNSAIEALVALAGPSPMKIGINRWAPSHFEISFTQFFIKLLGVTTITFFTGDWSNFMLKAEAKGSLMELLRLKGTKKEESD